MRLTRGVLAPLLVLTVALLSGCAHRAAPPGGRDHAGPTVSVSAPPGAATVAENAVAGTRDWRVHRVGAEHEIEGYSDHVSVLPGESFRLFVSTTAKGYRIQAFRTGWYGGAQARQVWVSPRLPGVLQPQARLEPVTRTVTAPWRASTTVPTAGWPEGSYLLRLTADSGAQRYVPITLRSAETSGRIVLLNGTTTWQAYNLWGGYSLYNGVGGYGDRARAVSFDRPYDLDGAVKYMAYEQPAVALAERLGLPLAYETDNDLHADPALLKGARALVVLGHDEYWSTAMRERATKARDSGVNIAFLGANEVNRHIRFGSTGLGADRLVICYKDLDDPIGRKDPAEITVDWRLEPRPRPESDLTGVFYECNPVDAAYVVYRPQNWIFAGTGARRGQRFPGMVGPEYDRVNPAVVTPRPIEVLAHSPLRCGNGASYADSAYYTVPGGAGVFAAGTMRWVCAMRGAACGHGVNAAARRFVDRATENVLRAMAQGPVAALHPATDNLREVKPLRGYPTFPGEDRD